MNFLLESHFVNVKVFIVLMNNRKDYPRLVLIVLITKQTLYMYLTLQTLFITGRPHH